MAFAKGNESTEGLSIKRYTGVASVFVLGVNLAKADLEKALGRELDDAPTYVGETEVNGEKITQVRLDFVVKVDSEKYKDAEGKPIEMVTRMPLYLRKSFRYNKDNTKTQVIDKYGRTAWVTLDELKTHAIPVYASGKPANIDADYRQAWFGEEELVKFLIAYLNIPSCQKYVNNEWVMKDAKELPDSEAMLEHIEDYFKGDFKELADIIAMQPQNKVKVLFGIRNTDDGKQYQTIYSRMFLKNNVSDYSRLDADVKSTQEAGALSTSVFECTDLHEHVVEATDFNAGPKDDPFAGTQASSPWDNQ